MNDATFTAPFLRWSPALLFILLALALLLSGMTALTFGRFDISVGTVTRILAANVLHIEATWTDAQAIVVQTVRLPRVLLAAVAGAGLALSGAALQCVFRNPLAGPQTLGVSTGAALGGALAITLSLGWIGLASFTLAGGALCLAAVVMLARGEAGRSSVVMLVLAGVVVSALAGALTGLLTYVADPETRLPGIVFWLLGSLATATPSKLAFGAACTAIGGAVLIALRWRLNLLSLGDEEARALGVRVERLRYVVLAAVCLAVSGQVAVSGVIGWVGLVMPHIGRMLVGPDHRVLLPASALLGAAYLVLVDTVARTALATEIPLGVLTAIVGAPVFAVLLRRSQTMGWSRD